jgi:hypothetical protein
MKSAARTWKRADLAQNAARVLMALDLLKEEFSIGHADMILSVAAAFASLPLDERELFRLAFDQIQDEMASCRYS